jgi:hypothetical protein
LAKFDLKEYARRGAALRAAELTSELESIYATFPELRRMKGRAGAGPAALGAAGAARKRKPMSPAMKKAVSIRMKKYWADRRKATAK